jgi:hypothetical protein
MLQPFLHLWPHRSYPLQTHAKILAPSSWRWAWMGVMAEKMKQAAGVLQIDAVHLCIDLVWHQ